MYLVSNTQDGDIYGYDEESNDFIYDEYDSPKKMGYFKNGKSFLI